MSVLYKAVHPTLGTPVVVKKLTLKGDPAHRERFRREASLMMDLRHENVVGVYDHFREGSGHYLVMEYVDGHSLAELLAREGALTAEESLWLAGRIAAALAHIHSHGVVHRDIKPSNILLSRDGIVKLADFGIAFTPGGSEDITAEGTALGTPSFMAPEQLEDARQADPRSDIWSLGVCFFEFITGRKFVSGPAPAAVREALPDAVRTVGLRLPPSLPPAGRRLIRKSLRMRPESRLKDGGAVLRLLRGSVGGSRPPDRLSDRLDGLIGAMDGSPPPESTPEDSGLGDVPREDGKTSDRIAAIRALFLPGRKNDRQEPVTGSPGGEPPGGRLAGNRADSGDLRSRWGRQRGRFLLAAALVVVLTAVLTAVLTPARLFARRTHGILRLELVFPESVPAYWLEGTEVRLFRESGGGLVEHASPRLRSGGEMCQLRSRRLSLPSGAYRLSWSLGDTVSWTSLRLPPVVETGVSGGSTLTVAEELGTPPVFPLALEWQALDAGRRRPLEGAALTWTRLDSAGGALESGGRYRFTIEHPGYRPAVIDVAVSPWRRRLRLETSLWKLPGRVEIRNESSRAAMPRLEGSGRYLNLENAPELSRIGRLPPGESTTLTLAPGTWFLSPGFSRDAGRNLRVGSGETVEVIIGEDSRGSLTLAR